MYQAIVFLPLLGAIIAALISLAGARARHPGGTPSSGAVDHAHATLDDSLGGRCTRRTPLMPRPTPRRWNPCSSNRQRQARAPPSW